MRKTIVLWVVLTLIPVSALIFLADRPAPQKTVTIGVLLYTDTNVTTLEGFKEGLAALGLKEGPGLRFVDPGPVDSQEQLGERMQAIMAEKPALVFASPTPAAIAAKRATAGSGVPVVFAPVNDPVAAGIVENLRAPEGNLTGVRLAQSDDMRLQSLVDVVPGIKKIFIPFNPADPSALATLRVVREAGRNLGLDILAKPFGATTDIAQDPDWVPADAQAVLLPRDGLVMSRIKEFVALCIARKLPLSTPRIDQVEQGALTGYGFVGREIGRQAARLGHALLQGALVSSLPVETARDYLFLNLDTAAKIGITVPAPVIRRTPYIFR